MIGSRDCSHESGSFSNIYGYVSGTTSTPSLLFAYPAYRQRIIRGRVTPRTDHHTLGVTGRYAPYLAAHLPGQPEPSAVELRQRQGALAGVEWEDCSRR
jgi:hypothetical protein